MSKKKIGCSSFFIILVLIVAASQIVHSFNKQNSSASLQKVTVTTPYAVHTPRPTVKSTQNVGSETRFVFRTPIPTAQPTQNTAAPITIQVSKTTTPVPGFSETELKKYILLTTGTTSPDVLRLKERLQELGYIGPSMLNSSYTDHTSKTIKVFQEQNGLKATGVADQHTQALLYSGLALTSAGLWAKAATTPSTKSATSQTSTFSFTKPEGPVATPQQNAPEVYVWVSRTGSKYHSRSSCSNMKSPSQVSRSTAISRGLSPCKVCKPR